MTATAVSTPNSAFPAFATLSPASSSEAPPRSDLLMLVDQIRHAAAKEHNASADSHSQLLNLIDELKLAVETPNETVLRLIYQPPQNAALRIVMDMGIFPLLVQHAHSGLSATELAGHTGAERALIVRLMRVMVALGLCDNPSTEVYLPNSKTLALTQPIGRDGVPCIYDLTLPTLSKLPDYFRDHQYVMPREYKSCPMQWAVGQSQFEWLAQRKLSQTRFNSYMASRRQGKPSWFDTFPVERLSRTAVARDDAVFLVDVGGNQGHDLVRFRKRFPSVPGRVVLQDLPKVVASAAVSSLREDSVEIMGYSFFDPQPVKGARIYYFRAIFHDWPDDVCRQILANTVSAMDAQYSRIVIVDFVLPDTHAPLLQSSLDIQMMSIGAGAERSESQWKELLGSAGLEIRSVWKNGPGMESVMEIGVR